LTVMLKVPPSTGGLGSTSMERITPSTLLLPARIVSCTALTVKSAQTRGAAGGGPEWTQTVYPWARALGAEAFR
jgi:hypothetical protein